MREEEACPYRIVDTAGSGFLLAFIAAPYDAWRGARASPDGRLMEGALRLVKTRTPARAGAFAVWGLVMVSFDCTLETLRGKRDVWNKIAAMGAVRGTLAARAGPRVALLRTLEGASLWAAVELFGLVLEASVTKDLTTYRSRPKLEGDESDTPRFHARTEDEQQPPLTLCGEWTPPMVTTATTAEEASLRSTDDDLSDQELQRQASQREAPKETSRRLWIGALAVAAAASAAHRYRYPLTQAAHSARAKFNKLP